MKITVFGSGYVGLVAAAGYADWGHSVECIDVDVKRLAELNKGIVPFYEPGLREVVERGIKSGRLHFSSSISDHFRSAEIHIIAVGTPCLPNGFADISAVLTVAKTIATTATQRSVIAIKSTVPPGTGDQVELVVREHTTMAHEVASVPEFLKEGTAVQDFFVPNRVVFGVQSSWATSLLRKLYAPTQVVKSRILVMDRKSSELSKYAANAMLATRVSFMNEMARLCDAIGADIHSIRAAVGSDNRIGPQFLYAGPGYGGSCLPKDVSALTKFAASKHVNLAVSEAAEHANSVQKLYVLEKSLAMLEPPLSQRKVTLWGLAYKAQTDDIRDSPAIPLVQALIPRGIEVRCHDPEAAHNFRMHVTNDVLCFNNEYDALTGSDLLIVMTEWRHLRSPDFSRIKQLMNTPRILDARNIWSRESVEAHGFVYQGVGAGFTGSTSFAHDVGHSWFDSFSV